jgi:hypothetical protein
MAYSSDGTTWAAGTITSFSGTTGIDAIVWGGDKFVAVGDNSFIAYSTDGINWTAVNNVSGVFERYSSIYGLAYGNGKFVAGDYYGTVAASTDGKTWAKVADAILGLESSNTNPYNGYDINCIAFGNNTFVAGGENGKIAYAKD